MSITKRVQVLVTVDYSMTDGGDADGISASSMADNLLAAIESERAYGGLTPDDICADKVSLELCETSGAGTVKDDIVLLSESDLSNLTILDLSAEGA